MIPISITCTGILLLMAVKFVGHKCGCPSESQLRKEQQQEEEQLELQPQGTQIDSFRVGIITLPMINCTVLPMDTEIVADK